MSVPPLPPGFVLDEEDNGLPPGFVIDPVGDAPDRSYMGALLSQVDPNGDQRRHLRRMEIDPEYADYYDPEGAEQRRLQRGRTSLDMKARMGPMGSIYMGLNALGQMDNPIGDVSRQGQKMMRGATGSPLEGALFSFDDELIGLIGGEDAKRRRRDEQYASAKDTPVTNFVGNLAGGVVSPANKVIAPLAGIKTGAQAANAGRLTLSQMALQGSKAGAIGGGLYGAGAAEGGARERLDDAAWGMMYGAAGGAVLGAGLGAGVNKFSTGQFFPGQTGAQTLSMTPQAFSRSKAGSLLTTALRRSEVPREDVTSAVRDAFSLFQNSANGGNRALTFAQALETTLEQRGYAQAAGNVKSIFQQLQASRFGRGMAQSLDDMAGSQESYLHSALDDTLGPETLARERARIRGERRAIGDAQDEAINQARTLRGNEEGTPIIMRAVENAKRDPNSTTTSWLNRAARDMGYTETGAGGGAKAVQAFENAAIADPLGFAKQVVRTINKARGNNTQLSDVALNIQDEFQQALNAATRFSRQANGRFGYNRMGQFNQGQRQFHQSFQESEAQTQKLMSLARDPRKLVELEAELSGASPQVQNAFRVGLKEDLALALRSGNIDDLMPYLGGVQKKSLNDALVRILGDDGQRISNTIRQVLDEQNWIRSVDARRLTPSDRTSIGRNADIRNLYTANPLTRLANKTPVMTTLVGDVASGAITGAPVLTAAKVIGHLTGPRGASIRQLAQTLALRPSQGGQNAGRLSRMGAPAGGAAGGSQTAASAVNGGSRGAPATGVRNPTVSQRAPWTPAQAPQVPQNVQPRVNTRAQRTANRLAQRALNARQRAADAQARGADEATLRSLRIEVRQAEAAALASEVLAKNERVITKVTERATRKQGRSEAARLKAEGRERAKIAAREAQVKSESERSAQSLDSALELERRANKVAKQEAEAMKDRSLAARVRKGTEDRVDTYTKAQRLEVAKKNAAAEIDPLITFEDTGHLAITIGDTPVIVPEVAKNSDDLVRMLSRVEDDVLGKSPEKWSDLTRTLIDNVGRERLVRSVTNGGISVREIAGGKLAAVIGGEAVIIPNPAKSAAELGLMLNRVEDDVARGATGDLGKLTQALLNEAGRKSVASEVMKGEVRGWRTPAERQTAQDFRTGAKIVAGGALAGGAAIGAAQGYKAYDQGVKAKRAKMIMETPELTKIVQRALKAMGQYEGRADGRYDGDVQIGVAQFQNVYGLGKTSDPGALDDKTLKELEDALVFEGKMKLADEVRAIRLGKRKPEEKK